MKIKYQILHMALIAMALSLAGCKKQAFVDLNTNPDVLYNIKPEEQFFNIGVQMHGQDFEQYYDNYRRIMHWMQMSTAQGGNAVATLTEVGNTNQRKGIFYPGLGSMATDVIKLAEKMTAPEQEARKHLLAIAEVLKIYYAFYVSDINGHLSYTEAFQARYGGPLTPKWDSQQELFNLWDARLKELIVVLKSSAANQVALTNLDQYYGGNAALWAKAANALRMRMGLRLLKRDNAKATTILKETVADASLLMTSNTDSWVYTAHATFTAGGNWNPEGFRAPAPTVNYMWNTSDPRIRLIYRKNNYTQANINLGITAGLLVPGTLEPTRRYIGAPVSPDVTQTPAWLQAFTGRRVNPTLVLDSISYLQERMFQPTYGGGDGQAFFPLITYADQQLMRAEMAARAITTENAENLYNQGVTASIQFYNTRAGAAKVVDYMAVTQAEIDAYLNHATVKYSPASALSLIAVQAYINFYKQPNEAWALFKRTGMPNGTTPLANATIMMNGSAYAIPRRAMINNPAPTDLNKVTFQAAIDAMKADPEFGTDPLNVYGRVWWDKQ